MGCCGNAKSSASIEYEAKGNNGTVKKFGTVAEVKIFLAQSGGGTYKTVPKSK